MVVRVVAGLIWQFALVLIVVRREQGSLRWPVLKKALWLNAPISPRTGKRSNRLWWMIIPLMVLLALEEVLPALPTPATRDARCSNASSVEPVCDNGRSKYALVCAASTTLAGGDEPRVYLCYRAFLAVSIRYRRQLRGDVLRSL